MKRYMVIVTDQRVIFVRVPAFLVHSSSGYYDHAAAARPATFRLEQPAAEQHRMAAAKSFQVGAVRERDLDLHEHVTGAGLRIGHVIDADVARGVPSQRPHGTNTTLSASRRRKSSSPSANRSSGSTTGSGSSSSGSSATASRIDAGVAERAPKIVSSRR